MPIYPSTSIAIDNKTIITNAQGQLEVNIDNDTINTNSNNQLQVYTPNIMNTIPVSYFSGTSGGQIIYWMPFQNTPGSETYRKVVLIAINYYNTTSTAQTLPFPTAFKGSVNITTNQTGMTLNVSTTGITFPTGMSNTATGIIIIEGT